MTKKNIYKIKNKILDSATGKFYILRIVLIFLSLFLKALFIGIHGFEIYGKLILFYFTSSLIALLISFRSETLIINLNKDRSILILKQIQAIVIFSFLLIFIINIIYEINYYLTYLLYGIFLSLRSFAETFINKHMGYTFNLKKIIANELNILLLILLFFNDLSFTANMLVYTSIIIFIEILFLIFFITKTLNFKINFNLFKNLKINLTTRFIHSLFSRSFYNIFYRFFEIEYNLSFVGLIRFIEQIFNFKILASPFRNIILKNLNNFDYLKKIIVSFLDIIKIFLLISLSTIFASKLLLSFDFENIKNFTNYFLLALLIIPLNLSNSFLTINESVIFFIKKDIIFFYYSLSKLLLISFVYLFYNLDLIFIYSSLLILNLIAIHKYSKDLKNCVV